MVSDRIHLTRVERELGITYCREITECEDAEKTCLAAGTVSDDDELPTSLLWLAKQFRRLDRFCHGSSQIMGSTPSIERIESHQ